MSITVDFTAAFSKAEMGAMIAKHDAQGFFPCFRATHVVNETNGTSYARSKSRECRQAACFDFDKAALNHTMRRAWNA